VDFNQYSDPDKALQASRQSAADGIYQLMQMREKADAEARVRANGTKARLISQHKGPNTDPTPGANYGTHSTADLEKAFNESHAHAASQWQAGGGAVGPTGGENVWYLRGFNRPTNSGYEANQNFAYQHDMQATDADLQAKTPEEREKYEKANKKSAVKGMWVLKRTGDLHKAMAKTQRVFRDHGFIVRQNYSK
jgi:hypothetical protein